MQTRQLKRWGVGATLVGALALGGCGTMDRASGMQTWTLQASEDVQSAAGKVKVGTEKDGNTKVKVEVERLAQAATVHEDTTAYVVWLRPDGGQPQNVGVLTVDKNLKGKLETKTPFKQFQLIVTAEASANAMLPSGPPVMNAHITVPS